MTWSAKASMLSENNEDAKGPPPRLEDGPGSGSFQSQPSRSEAWRSAYSRRGSRAVLLNELRLQARAPLLQCTLVNTTAAPPRTARPRPRRHPNPGPTRVAVNCCRSNHAA
ncbi:hypothetical protein PLESTM_000520800 [Pleodorina starrii]|nr:hypothetical protein PLESTM_000520800 [Pleodorina starrii]